MLMPTITKKSWTFEKTMKQCAYKIQGHTKKNNHLFSKSIDKLLAAIHFTSYK